MSLLELVLLAIGLAMDATAVAGARGLAARVVRRRDALLVAVFFGGSQALMPVLGWALGAALVARVKGWGDWVTGGVFLGLGVKMIADALRSHANGEERTAEPNVFGLKVLGALAIATSIDALAAGVTLAFSGLNIAFACAVIGAVTAVLSFAGVYIGRRFGARAGKRLDLLGGGVLVGLAVKAVVDHYR